MAIIVPERQKTHRVLNLLPVKLPRDRQNLSFVAYEQDITLMHWQKDNPHRFSSDLLSSDVELVIMSCFPWRVPAPLLRVPKFGWWNLHPSLLPAYRGPNPLYWQLKAGETETGISLHQVDETLDTGPIISQATCSLDGDQDMASRLATLGAGLVIKALEELAEGRLSSQAQNPVLATYQSFPEEK